MKRMVRTFQLLEPIKPHLKSFSVYHPPPLSGETEASTNESLFSLSVYIPFCSLCLFSLSPLYSDAFPLSLVKSSYTALSFQNSLRRRNYKPPQTPVVLETVAVLGTRDPLIEFKLSLSLRDDKRGQSPDTTTLLCHIQ